MQIHVLAKLAQGPQLPISIIPTTTYGELNPDSSQVPICLRNLSAHPIVIPTKVVVGRVTPANQVPLVVLLMESSGESTHGPQKYCILEELNCQGLKEWSKEEEHQARKLLVKWKHLFAHSDLDLGKTSLIKHQIDFTDWMPFKEHYWQIPPFVQ